jgi:hypothetical protein
VTDPGAGSGSARWTIPSSRRPAIITGSTRASPPCRPAVGRHHQRPGHLAGRPDPLSCRHAGRLIHACDVGEDGTLGLSRAFAGSRPSEGYPDGPTVDSEGCLWIGLFRAGRRGATAPHGELLETVAFPSATSPSSPSAATICAPSTRPPRSSI